MFIMENIIFVIVQNVITWGKLDLKTTNFIIESVAIIVAPLIFAYLLNW